MLLLPNCPLEEAVRVLERMSQATPEGQRCSAGIAWWDSHESAEDVVARADAAASCSLRALEALHPARAPFCCLKCGGEVCDLAKDLAIAELEEVDRMPYAAVGIADPRLGRVFVP